ncbi:TIGR02266 family protein, partial [Pyxidicoccus sp. 3LFB2]
MASWVEGLGTVLSAAQSLQLVVALRPEEAGLELKVEAPGYPRAAVERLAEEAKRSGGTFVELWRMPKAERDGFRATTFGGGTPYRSDERAAIARALQQHVESLAASGSAPSAPPANPMEAFKSGGGSPQSGSFPAVGSAPRSGTGSPLSGSFPAIGSAPRSG